MEHLGPAEPSATHFTAQASETLAARDYVNVWSSSGNFRIRKAKAEEGFEAHGFVDAAVTSGDIGIVRRGVNTGLSGQTPGVVWLSATPGLGDDALPTPGAGVIAQRIGIAVSSSAVIFNQGEPIGYTV